MVDAELTSAVIASGSCSQLAGSYGQLATDPPRYIRTNTDLICSFTAPSGRRRRDALAGAIGVILAPVALTAKLSYKISATIPDLVRPQQETEVVCPLSGAPNSRWFSAGERRWKGINDADLGTGRISRVVSSITQNNRTGASEFLLAEALGLLRNGHANVVGRTTLGSRAVHARHIIRIHGVGLHREIHIGRTARGIQELIRRTGSRCSINVIVRYWNR